MKIRSDFVTNSSSSSFVIAYKDVHNNSDAPIDRLNSIVKSLLDNTDHYETECAEYFKSVEDIEAYLKDNYYDSFSIDDLLSSYGGSDYTSDDLKQFIDDGYTIAIKEVSYHDELTKDLIELFDETNSFFVVLNNFD